MIKQKDEKSGLRVCEHSSHSPSIVHQMAKKRTSHDEKSLKGGLAKGGSLFSKMKNVSLIRI